MAIDKEKIEMHIKGILEALGEKPEREGLIDTPKRVAKMYEEIFDGINYSNEDIVEMFNKTFSEELDGIDKCGNMVIIKDIDFFSYCEHHMALMYNMKAHIAYIPNEKIIGLSKVARIVDLVGKRLQLQERIGMDISEIIKTIVGTENVAVIIEGEHGCMTTRGIKKNNSKTITSIFSGLFETNESIKNQILLLYK